jgi:hypothetical protein
MEHTASRQRLYAALLGPGACILLFRTTLMIAQGYLGILLPWVAGLLLVELALDLGCLLGSIRWWVAGDEARARLPLRLGAAATILHAVRVLIYALGCGNGKDLGRTQGRRGRPAHLLGSQLQDLRLDAAPT